MASPNLLLFVGEDFYISRSNMSYLGLDFITSKCNPNPKAQLSTSPQTLVNTRLSTVLSLRQRQITCMFDKEALVFIPQSSLHNFTVRMSF